MEINRLISSIVMKNYIFILLSLLVFTSCTKETGLFKTRCTNRLCCQRAAQHKQPKHTHMELFLTHKHPESSKKEVEIKAEKEYRPSKF